MPDSKHTTVVDRQYSEFTDADRERDIRRSLAAGPWHPSYAVWQSDVAFLLRLLDEERRHAER